MLPAGTQISCYISPKQAAMSTYRFTANDLVDSREDVWLIDINEPAPTTMLAAHSHSSQQLTAHAMGEPQLGPSHTLVDDDHSQSSQHGLSHSQPSHTIVASHTSQHGPSQAPEPCLQLTQASLLAEHQVVLAAEQRQRHRYQAVMTILNCSGCMSFEQYAAYFGRFTSMDPSDFGDTLVVGLDRRVQEWRYNWQFPVAPGMHATMGWFLAPRPFSTRQAAMPVFTDDNTRAIYYPAVFHRYNDELYGMGCLAILIKGCRSWWVHESRVTIWTWGEDAILP